MFTPQPLDILFLTNFSDYCFRGIPVIAHMAAGLKVRLTLMHVYDPAHCSHAKANAQLGSFFPEADRYAACQRIAVAGQLIETVKRHLNVWPVNLIVAPASDDIGIPRIGHRCKRSRLIQECGVPVWTIGRRVQLPKLVQPVRNVACWLDFYSTRPAHLPFAVEYASKIGAKLHLLRALPEINEGSLGLGTRPDKPLRADTVATEVLQLCANAPIHPEVHISSGEGRSVVAQMLRECDADIVFLGNEMLSLTEWLGVGLRLGDYVPCPAIYVGDHSSVPVWNLDTSSANEARNTARANLERAGGDLIVAAARNGHRALPGSWLSQLGLF